MPALVAPQSVASKLARYCTNGVPREQPPGLDVLFRELLFPNTNPVAREYLARRSELRENLERIIQAVRDDSRRAIEVRAYFKYINRGADDGDDQRDWYNAERELVTEQLRLAAYEKYLHRGKADGGHLDDWCAVEQEMAG